MRFHRTKRPLVSLHKSVPDISQEILRRDYSLTRGAWQGAGNCGKLGKTLSLGLGGCRKYGAKNEKDRLR